jgi:hypothetical protein
MERLITNEKEISIVLSPHALQRFKERMNANFSDHKVIEILNAELNKGLIKHLKNEEGAFLLGFEGQNFYFVIKKVEGGIYTAKTFEWKLLHDYPKIEVDVRYLSF